ncbi:hypothetical protein HUT19_41910 (plasmid) [Streptomyces sp. NA02950]|uniref:hypothetical protein n=1 Tax=Streptomyces sp. NA02950 TaxID=2742137 RepID=UPI001590972D|nr:hypothetical protein [Streptomyces sp. NA02950]QKV98276.1 hypothetical protein HUT19_41910 [Streptomyces sp. NA02950]
MNNARRRARICIAFARQEVAETFGPVADLDAEDRAWRRESLASTFKGYTENRVTGVGADWREALKDAADRGRIDLAEYDGDLTVARDALLHGAIWEFVTTADGMAILDTCAS